IGYYSHAKILDHPGLCSPEVARLKSKKIDEEVAALKPEWLVLRGVEYQETRSKTSFLDDYEEAKVFDKIGKVGACVGNIYGVNYLFTDAQFLVLRRRPSSS